MATRERERFDGRDGLGDAGDGPTANGSRPETGGDRPLGSDVRVVTRETVVDGTVRHEIGFERRPGA